MLYCCTPLIGAVASAVADERVGDVAQHNPRSPSGSKEQSRNTKTKGCWLLLMFTEPMT